MELANSIYPMRAVIRCKAKHLLMTDEDGSVLAEPLDEPLLKELATTLFQSRRCEAIYEPHRTRDAASAVEDQVALELVASYRNIMQQRQSPIVQDLNALL